jgi:vacuolar-type H+-ATPase subunit I/STV1
MNRFKSIVLGSLLTTISVAAISQNAHAVSLPQRESFDHQVVAFNERDRNLELRREQQIREQRERQLREQRLRAQRERQLREQRLRAERLRELQFRNHR